MNDFITKPTVEIEFDHNLHSAMVIAKSVGPEENMSSTQLRIIFPFDCDMTSEQGRLMLQEFIFAAQYALDHPPELDRPSFNRPKMFECTLVNVRSTLGFPSEDGPSAFIEGRK